jgi:hypothetical protein
MLVISTREFRNNQKSFLDIADSGKQVVISRGKKQAYLLMPISQDDFVVSPEVLERLEESRRQFYTGEITACRTPEDIIEHLDSL